MNEKLQRIIDEVKHEPKKINITRNYYISMNEECLKRGLSPSFTFNQFHYNKIFDNMIFPNKRDELLNIYRYLFEIEKIPFYNYIDFLINNLEK